MNPASIFAALPASTTRPCDGMQREGSATVADDWRVARQLDDGRGTSRQLKRYLEDASEFFRRAARNQPGFCLTAFGATFRRGVRAADDVIVLRDSGAGVVTLVAVARRARRRAL